MLDRARQALLLALCAVLTTGCSRAYYRQQADREIYCLENAAASRVPGATDRYAIQTNPHSRMFDPNSPDCPPMPPDDPTSHQLMQCVDSKKGWSGWKCYGNTPYVENPRWEAYLPRDENGAVVLDRRGAVEMALLNSREYQQQLENLYLSALDVSYQRFRFDAQFFGGNSTFFEHQGSVAGGGDSQSTLTTDTGLEMRKLYAPGGELVVGVANSLVWQFAGPNDYNGTTLLDFSLMQPLLRAGGRAVVLEALTDSERALLANVRQMERFRHGFYAQIVAGRDPGSGPSPSGITLNNLTPGGGGAVGGLLALLRQQVLIRNQEANVVALRDSLEQLKALFEANELDSFFQVEQARLQLYQAQIRLLNLKNQYDDALDAYKLRLGVPPSLEMAIRDPLLSRFDLIDPALTAAQDKVTSLLENVRDPEPGSVLAEDVAGLESVARECRTQIEAIPRDLRTLGDALPARREQLKQMATRAEAKQGEIDPAITSIEALEARVARLHASFAELARQLEANLAALEPYQRMTAADWNKPPAELDIIREQLKKVIGDLSGQMIELSLIQARARLDSITLQPLELSPVKALEIARENRLDWKNARAALVDVWRQVEVTANSLESDLDLTFSGDLSTVGGNPFRFRGTNSRLRVGVEFDAPLTRLEERNDYRTALINYQQARRQYYAYEDNVDRALRQTLRQVRLAQINFEQRRAAVYVAANQVELKQFELLHKPAVKGAKAYGSTTARDVVDALNNLLTEQDNFLAVWVDYEVQRLNLAFDLGTMELDQNGMWIDRGEYGSGSTESGVPELRQVPADNLEPVPAPPPMPAPPAAS